MNNIEHLPTTTANNVIRVSLWEARKASTSIAINDPQIAKTVHGAVIVGFRAARAKTALPVLTVPVLVYFTQFCLHYCVFDGF